MHFSIIIPAFNEEDFIGKTLASLYPQRTEDLFSYAFLIVDNGSNDGTAEKIEQYKKENPSLEVEVINEPEKGFVPARKAGAEKAIDLKGKDDHWLVTADADTTYSSNWLINFYKTINKTKADFIQGVAKTTQPPEDFRPILNRFQPALELGRKLVEGNAQVPASDCAACFSATLYLKTGGYVREFTNGTEQIAETWRLFVKARLLGFSRAICSENVAVQDGRRDTRNLVQKIRYAGMTSDSYQEDVRQTDDEYMNEVHQNPETFATPEALDDAVVFRVAVHCLTWQLVEGRANLTGDLKELQGEIQSFVDEKSHRDQYSLRPGLAFEDALDLANQLRSKLLKDASWRV